MSQIDQERPKPGSEQNMHTPCCSSHGVDMTCEDYRRTHFVEVRPCCGADADLLRKEGIDPKGPTEYRLSPHVRLRHPVKPLPEIIRRANQFDLGKDESLTSLLMRAWGKAEPNHSITHHPTSYIATFAEMAKAVEDSEWLETVKRKVREEVAAEYDAWASEQYDV